MNALTTNTTDVQRMKNHIFDDELFPLLDSVYTFAYRLTNDAVQAEDLAQDTYFKAWKSLDTYTSGTNARAWLFQICRNAFYNEYRTKSRAPRKVDFEDIVAYHNEDDPVAPRYFGFSMK